MDEPASDGSVADLLERLALAGVGLVALGAERADAVTDSLSRRGGVRREEAREALDELVGRWRGDAGRLSERTGTTLANVFRDLGLVTRDDFDELELRVAQLEHRLRLVEGEPPRELPPPRA